MGGNRCARRISCFGRKVTLRDGRFDHDEAFDPRPLRLADIDGSGHVDLVSLRGPDA